MAGGSTSFNPSEARIRFAVQSTTEGVLPTAGWHQLRSSTVGFTAEKAEIEDNSLDSDGVATLPFEGKFTPSGTLDYNVFAEDHGLLLGCAQLKCSTTTVEASVAFKHKLAPTETSKNYECLVADQDRSIGLRDYWSDVVSESLTLSFSAGSVLSASQSFQCSRFSRWDAGSQTSGTGTTVPQIRGLLNTTERALSDNDLYLEYQSISGSPTDEATVRAKLGSAASFAGSGVTVKAATWTDLVDESDLAMGIDGLQIYIPNFTGATAADTFRVNHNRPTWTVSLPTRVVFNEIDTTVKFADAEFRVQEGTCTITNPWQVNSNVGGIFSDASRRRGKRSVVWTFNRDLNSVDMINRLETGETFSIVADFGSKVEISGTAANNKYALVLTSKNCRATGPEVTVTDGTSLTEAITASAARSTDATYPSDLTMELTNGTADLGA